MRENRPYGLEGGETGSTGLPYPYIDVIRIRIATNKYDILRLAACPCTLRLATCIQTHP